MSHVGRTKKAALAAVAGLLAGTVLAVSPAQAEDPLFLPWTDLLPSFTDGYDPSSENDCKSGKIQCVDSVIHEMDRRFEPLADECDHNSMFSLTYLRTTERYRAAATMAGFFSDPGFINHQDAVFARYYFDAWDDYRHGRLDEVSPSWQIAFGQADGREVSGSGNLFLGMSAHVNRDLPMVLADIGLVKPDGSSRKPDHDKVNQFLNTVIEPLFDEAAARFDPTIDDSQIDGTTMDETGTLQLLVAWREQAWRNAERLVNATSAAERSAVVADIERQAEIEANLLVVATGYSRLNVQAALDDLAALGASEEEVAQATLDRVQNVANGLLGSLFSSGADRRDRHCAANG